MKQRFNVNVPSTEGINVNVIRDPVELTSYASLAQNL